MIVACPGFADVIDGERIPARRRRDVRRRSLSASACEALSEIH